MVSTVRDRSAPGAGVVFYQDIYCISGPGPFQLRESVLFFTHNVLFVFTAWFSGYARNIVRTLRDRSGSGGRIYCFWTEVSLGYGPVLGR